jgi:signal transduction histidine kinase
MKKHAMAQRLTVMNNWWRNLLMAREEGKGIVDDDATVGHLHPIPVSHIYTQIGHEINMLFKQLNSFNLGDAMDSEEIFDAAAFVREYINHHDPMFEYQCELLDKPANIRFPKEAFRIIMDNIASNACSHGFKGRETEDNIIRIIMKTKGSDLVIKVSNNGIAMPAKMNSEKVFAYGDTTEEGVGEHAGLGGFQIKDLMTKFGGEVELELEASSEFPVTYKMVFRDVNIYK